ncbi:MAG: hypothetical protein ACP5OU_03120 [Methanothrix sp.]
MINPDTSGYAPAELYSLPLQADLKSLQAGDITNDTLSMDEKEAAPAENGERENGESKFRDVTKLARGINPDILPRIAAL